jgi:hypothetical protein
MGPMAWVLRWENAWPVIGDVTKCGAYHSIHLRATLLFQPSAPDLDVLCADSVCSPVIPSVARNLSSLCPMPVLGTAKAPSKLPLTTVLHIVVSEPRLSRLLALLQRRPFGRSQLPQPG